MKVRKKASIWSIIFVMVFTLLPFSSPKVEADSPVSTTIYVATDGDDDTGDGTVGKPYKSLGKAKEVVRTLPKDDGDIVVQIADGFYPIDETLVFTAEDSGSASSTIRYEAAPGAKPVISAGEMLDKDVWEVAEGLTQTGGLTAYKTTLERDDKLRAIYVNDHRANMTVSEQIGSTNRTVDGTPTVSFTSEDNSWAWQNGNNIRAAIVFDASVGLTTATKNPENIEAESTGGSTARWARPFVTFASIEDAPEASGKPGGVMLRFQMPYGAISQSLSNNTQYNPNNNQVIRNAFEFFNKPGDFYFDQADQTLYYIPLEGEDINTADVVIPKHETVIDVRGIPVGDRLDPIDGSDDGRVQYVTFDGLKFAHTDYKLYELEGTYKFSDRPNAETTISRGFASVQGSIVNTVYFPSSINWHETFYRGYDIPPAAVMINAARHIKVLNGEIGLAGFNGIHIENDVKEIEVTGNYIVDTLASGISVGHPHHIYENDKADLHESRASFSGMPIRDWAGVDKEKFAAGTEAVPENIYITNNFLYRNCYGFPGANTLQTFYTTNMQVLHNYFYDSTYGAMSIGWGWDEYDGYGFTSHGTNKDGGPYHGTHETSLARSPEASTTSRNNKINYNRVEEIATVVNDTGAIYSLGRQGDPGNLPGGGTWDDVDHLSNSPVTDITSNWHPDNWTNFTEMNYNFLDPNPTLKETSSNNWTNGFHPDEGSTFIKMIGNVVQSKLSHAPGQSRLYEFNNWKRKSDMYSVGGYVDGNNNQNGAPRITFDNYKSEDRIWPLRGNEIVLNSGLENEYTHMIPRSLIADTEFELASNVIMGKNETLSRRGLLKAEDTVWLAPAGTTEFVEGSTMTKAAGNETSIQSPTTAGQYKLFIVYDEQEKGIATSKHTVYVDLSMASINVEDGQTYDVSATLPLELTLSEDNEYTLNGNPVESGHTIATEGNWTLVVSDPSGSTSRTINFTTEVSLANKLLPAEVSVAPGETVRFAYDLGDATKQIWISSSSGGHFDGGDDETMAFGDAIAMEAPMVPGPYVIYVLAEDGETLSQSHASVVVRDMTPVDIPREGLDLWLKADEGVERDSNGDVTGWTNMGNVPAKLTPANVPGSGGDGLGVPDGNPKIKRDGYEFVEFDANSRPLKAAGFKDYNGETEMTIYTLVKPTTTANNSSDQSGLVYFGLNEAYQTWAANQGWSGINLGVGTNRVNLRFGNADGSVGGGGQSFDTTATNGLVSVRAQLNGNTRTVFVDNESIGNGTNAKALTGNVDDLAVGYTMAAATPYRFMGEVLQILIYDRVLTDEEVAKIEDYFNKVKAGTGGPANPVEELIDKTLLNALIEDANNLDQTIYTDDSWNAFVSVLDEAQAIADAEVDQETADESYYALRSAFNELELLPSGVGTAVYGTPVLGGEEIDPLWNETASLPIRKHLTLANGPADGSAKVLWDEQNLYVLVHVKDPVLNSDSGNAHEKDSVEIFVDESNSKQSSYGEGMGQYRIDYLNGQTFNPESISTGFASFAKIVDGGYYVEAKIPFKAIDSVEANHVIGFDLQINDAQASGSRQDIIMWHDETGNSYMNGSQWGEVTLLGELSEPGESAGISGPSTVIAGQPVALSIGIDKLVDEFDTFSVKVSYDPEIIEFETVIDDASEEVRLADSAITNLRNNWNIDSAVVTEETGEIFINASTADGTLDQNSGKLFDLNGKAVNITSADGTSVSLSDFIISNNGEDRPIITENSVHVVKVASELDTTPPSDVTGERVTAGNKTLTIKWTDPTDDDLETIKISGHEDTVIDAVYVNKGDETYTFTELSNGTRYDFIITALDANGNESSGVVVFGTPKAPTIPVNPSPSDNTPDTSDSTQVEVNNNGQISVKPAIDANGKSIVELDADTMKSALEQVADGKLQIMVEADESLNDLEVEIPLDEIFSNGQASIHSIEIDAGLATATVSTTLTAKDAADAENVSVSIAKVDNSSLPAQAQDNLKDAKVIDFNLSVDGEEVSEFDGKDDVQVTVPYELKTGENPNKVVVYYMNDLGELEIVNNGLYNEETGNVEFKPKHNGKYAVTHVDVSFEDVSKAWAKDSIEALAARGIVNGIGGGLFNPDGNVTRAEFLTMLMNLFELTNEEADTTFSDVQTGTWYHAEIATAQQLGIVNGRTDGSFGVNDEISREDMAVMAYQALQVAQLKLGEGSTNEVFTDQASIANYAQEAVAAMQAAEIINGMGNGEFAPKSHATRAQAAVIIYKLLNQL